jgi:hypothetical protein
MFRNLQENTEIALYFHSHLLDQKDIQKKQTFLLDVFQGIFYFGRLRYLLAFYMGFFWLKDVFMLLV